MSRDVRKMICLVLALAMAMGPPTVYAQQPVVADAGAAAGGAEIDLSYITPETTAVVVAHPRRVLASPEMEMLPIEVISAAGKKELGIDPLEIEQILAIIEPPGEGPPQTAVIIKFSKPQQMGKILPPLMEKAEKADLNGRVYMRAKDPMEGSLYAVDRQTLIVGHDGLLRRLVTQDGPPAAGPMSKLLAGTGDPPDLMAVVVVDPLRPLIEQMLPAVPVPHPFESVKKLPGLLSSIEAEADLTGKMGFSLALQARDEASADEIESIIDHLMDLGQQTIQAQMAQQAASDDPIEQAMAQYMTRINKRMMDAVRPVRDENRFELAASGEGQMQVAVIGILVALLLPAVNSVRQAARRNQSHSTIRMIGLGLHSYIEQYGRLPVNIVDEDGKPLLSWRVRLLPYLEESDLYDQFKLDEPWDSEHNRQLIPLMPAVFRSPLTTVAHPGKTTYLGVAGEGAIFGDEKGLRFRDVRDGTSNTVAMVEANDDRAVVWTAPEDWQFDPDNPLAGLGEARGGIFLALMLDGSTRVISEDVDLAIFKALVTYAGGEVVGDF